MSFTMKKQKIGLIVLLIIFLLSIIMILIYSKERILQSENYFPSISPSDYSEVCRNKHVNWGKKTYELKFDEGISPYILTVDNFNHSSYTRVTCNAGFSKKYPYY